ncbi:MAG: GNAT family N-acetyltransferase [Actinomycetota bacterium]
MTVERGALRTPRLVLEPHRIALAQPTWEAIRLSLPELSPWMPWAHNASFETTRSFCERVIAEWDAGRSYEFAVIENEAVIGGCGLHAVVPLAAKAEVGYWIRSDRCGEGIATEAASAVRDFAFDTLGLRRLELRAGTLNTGSRRVAEKSGFLLEGTLREGGVGADGPYDAFLFGMIASDPRP